MAKYYCNNEIQNYYLHNTEELPATVAMTWCMEATQICRLFDKEHLQEFLYRLAFVLNSKNVFENWLLEDKLFEYKYNGEKYAFTIQDIESHLGMENRNSYLDMTNRNDFFQNLGTQIAFLSFKFLMSSFVFLVEAEVDDEDVITYKVDANEISQKLPANENEIAEKASLFSREILKNIDTTIFSESNALMQAKLEELEQRRTFVASIPEFEYEKISLEIRYNCVKASFSPEEAQTILDEPNDEDIQYHYKKYIYLAWLFGNNLMVKNGFITADEVEGVNLDSSDYDVDGYNYLRFYNDNNLEAMKPYLKGLFFEK